VGATVARGRLAAFALRCGGGLWAR
jgi:hypothetical protein